MRKSRKVIGRGAVLVVVAAVIATVTACTPQSGSTPDNSQAASKPAAKSVDLRKVLVPMATQPETRFVRGPMTLKEAAGLNALVSPPSVAFAPKSCETYLADAIGSPLDKLDGWVQFGSRVHKDHNDNFIQLVIDIPTGADQKLLDRVRAALAPCADGTVTLEGRVTGKITYEERSVPALAGAATFSITGTTKFSEQPGTPEAELVRNFELPPNSQLLLNADQACVAAVNITGMGNTLMVVHESDVGLANELTGSMFGNLQKVL